MAAENSQLLIENDQLRNIYVQIRTKAWAELSDEDKVTLGTFWFVEVDRLELQFRLYRRNRVPLDNIVFGESDLKLLPSWEWWRTEARDAYEPELVTYFEQLIEDTN